MHLPLQLCLSAKLQTTFLILFIILSFLLFNGVKGDFNFNTRSCGISKEFALIVFDEVLAEWADEFVVFNQEQFDVVSKLSKGKVIVNLDIEDIFDFKDEELINLITTQYNE